MKIRLAKHTRALAAALAFCVLSAVPAYAQEDDTVEVPGVPVTLSLPAGSLILTRETPVDDAIFETLNVDGAAILENMNKNDLYLDAVLFKPPLEFTLVRVQLPSNSLIDWESSEDAQLCAFVEAIYEQLDNITADDCSVYSSEHPLCPRQYSRFQGWHNNAFLSIHHHSRRRCLLLNRNCPVR